MRAGLSTIQQTLTPEAATVLNQSIAEAARRNHGQTTPLHVAATLLSAPNGYLRQACIRSHPNSSHPLQCRALELCFSVALERLPTTAAQAATSSSPADPPISNALMAALKRAQAHQRRGCPEQQQQPLLAVKVELEQLIISILDDPSVSRVMREASFSSPAVKAAIEQSLMSSSSTSASAAAAALPSPSQSNINPPSLLLSSSRPCPSPSPSSHPHGPKIGFVGGGFRPGGFGSGGPGISPSPSPISQAGGGMSMYLNPRLQQQQRSANCNGNSVHPSSSGQSREDVKKVIEILSRARKKNPVLVGESEPEAVVREVLRRIESKELGGENSPLSNVEVEVVPVEKELGLRERRGDTSTTAVKLKELGGLIERKMSGIVGGRKRGLILDLGDMKWLVDQPPSLGVISNTTPVAPQQGVSEAARAAVVEMGKVLARFANEPSGGSGRLWVIGTATCETYLRCQVYHPTMENEWDLQAVSIAARASTLPGKLTRLGTNGFLGGSLDTPIPLKILPHAAGAQPRSRSERSFPRNLDASTTTKRTSCCSQCMENYNQEVSKLPSDKQDQSVSEAVKSEATRNQLPQWLQKAKISDQSQQGEDTATKQKHQELLKKWSDTCQRLHPGFHQNGSVDSSSIRPTLASTPTPVTGLYTNPLLAARQALHPMPSMRQLPKILGNDLRLEISPMSTPQPVAVATTETSPKSPVRTDLVLGQTKTREPNANVVIDKSHQERIKDLLSCISSETLQDNNAPIEPLESVNNSVLGSDIESFKRILKGLTEKVWWQKDAASAVASTVTQCKTGNRRRRAGGAKGDTWLLFTGPDRTGKKKLAMALSELVWGVSPIIISLGSRRDCDESEIISFRGKTVLDRIGEAIRRNPFSVIMLQDVDEANMLLRGSIKRAMERGRFTDSYGREISLGNIIFILTASCSEKSLSNSVGDNGQLDEEKLANVASGGWQLRVSVGERRCGGKRQPSWLIEEEDERAAKQRREAASLSFDLNEMADDADEDGLDGSRNSSDLTVEHGDEKVGGQQENSMVVVTISAACRDLLGLVDDAIVFKTVDFGPIKQTVERTVRTRIRTIVGEKARVSIDEAALERILGGVWLGRMGLDSWVEKVLVPSLNQIKCSWIGLSEEESCNSSSNKVVRVEMEEEESEPRSHGDWLPSRVSVRVGAF